MTSTMRFDKWENSLGGGNVSLESGNFYSPGSVIQVVDYKYPSLNDNYTVISSGVEYLTPVTITMTPKFANSKLIVHSEVQSRFIQAFGMTAGIKRDGVNLNGSLNFGSLNFIYKDSSVNHHFQMVCNTSVIAGSTEPTTFTAWLKPYSGTGEWNQGWGNNYIQVWEIAQ